MLVIITGLACLLPSALSQTGAGGGGYTQQQGGFYPSPVRSAPYPAAAPAPAPATAPEQHSGPTAPGPSGGGYPAPFFPPTGGAFLGLTPVCAKVAIAITRLHSLVEPIKALIVGAFVFFAVKNYVIPYLVYYARAAEDEEELLERSLGKDAPLDAATIKILRAVSKGVCLERIACTLGKKAKAYPITKEVVRAIDSTETPERFLSVFRAAATDDADAASCEAFSCRKRSQKKKTKSGAP